MTSAWHAEARRLLESGMIVSEIGKRMGRTPSMVRWALDIDNERQKTRERINLRRNEGRRYSRRKAAAVSQTQAPESVVSTGVTLPFVSFLADHKSQSYRLAASDYFDRRST